MNVTVRDIPIYINCRDRVSDLRKLVDWLTLAGYENVVLLDNDSSYEPLLNFYRSECPYEVRYLKKNYGSRSLWLSRKVPKDHPFVFTDPDVVPIPECPSDVVEHMWGLLQLHPHPKIGLGLYLEDVPATLQSLEWEKVLVGKGGRFREVRKGLYNSQVDTTFALYRPNGNGRWPGLEALRMTFPYQARHLPWYHINDPSEEEQYYLDRAIRGPRGTSWQDQ